MSQIIMRESEGIFGIFNEKVNEINAIDFSKDEFVLILDRPEKPGNVGAIFRSYEAFGFKNIIIAETNLDIYNPIIIRSSLGAVFKLNLFKLSFEVIKNQLKKETNNNLSHNNFHCILFFIVNFKIIRHQILKFI